MKRKECADHLCSIIAFDKDYKGTTEDAEYLAYKILDYLEIAIGMLPPKRPKLINKKLRSGVITHCKLMVPEWEKE